MKFLVIGLGSIGMRHAKNLIAMGHEVTGDDPDPGQESIAEANGISCTLPPGDMEFDAAIICSPTKYHSEWMRIAAKNGWHIFVEKPISHAQDDYLKLALKTAREKNLVIMVGSMLRFHPNVMMAKSLIKSPKSALFQVLQKNDKPAYRRDGVLLNWGAHEIDLALYLLGPASVRWAKGNEERASVALLHESGTTSVIDMDYLTEPEIRKFKIYEKDGTAHEVDLTLHDWNNIYIEEMKAFIGLIEGKPDPRCATGEDGLAVLRVIEKAKEIAS